MDRLINYSGQIPLETDLLNTNRSTMIALGKLAGAIFGTGNIIVNGLGVVPTGPASLNVNVNAGEIYSLQNVDNAAFSSLPADTTDTVVKQGIQLQPAALACPAPTTAGFSINYLIEATFAEVDSVPVVLPYYNASNPTQAFSGPNNTGVAQNTKRAGTVSLQAKAGVAATTGTQTTPAVDVGYVALAVVTVANGQATITAGNIVAATNGQILSSPVSAGRLLNIQKFTTAGTYTYTPTPGTNKVRVTVVGAGGGGGACATNSASQCSAGSGGSGGGMAMSLLTSGFSGVTITVGAGGPGGAAGVNAGSPGGSSSFGALLSATGGGNGTSNQGTTATITGCNAPGSGSSGNLLNVAGGAGSASTSSTNSFIIGGNGGGSYLGGATLCGSAGGGAISNPGVNATGSPGVGGSGAAGAISSTGKAGGNGADGAVLIEEFA
ncbi:hypothetical protein ISN76_12850 [Dyella halodurans]|uniref:Glycine-rich domain-containing protein n=1 Tax=Dyella halodurans TaxID=1920171 RepID=A0ABV9C0D4_9GAMM|nr:hypothetical protein [Dyella halodurans]